jgi:DNA-directed RNA polymerase specialized sigma subunit
MHKRDINVKDYFLLNRTLFVTEIPLDALFELAEQKQAKAIAFLKKEKGKSFTSEEIASAIGAPEEVEMIFRSLEHAAANMDHQIKKIPADPPFHSRYQYSTGVM